jgi:ubiquinone/menaquinone biosynthesis C-methylase UbiE
MFTAIHHLPHPEKMLREVKRVLKKGGIFIAVDGAVPKLFRFLFKAEKDERARKHGIIENLISFREYEKLLEKNGMSKENLTVYTNPSYVEGTIPKIGARILNKLPRIVIKHIFPVGIVIQYTKL